MSESTDPGLAKALTRYRVISPYLAMEPKRGQKRVMLEDLASRTWAGPDGEPFQVAAETIRVWVYRYRQHGLDGLRDKERPQQGIQALSAQQVELICDLKREVPERSLDRIITIAEGTELVTPGVFRRSTVHRALRSHGLSARKARVPDAKDLDRFEADVPNDLWHSDLLVGPWLPDPDRPGKVRRAYLYAFIDDHSRLLLHGRFSFKGDLPALELVFRRSVQRWGLPRRVYYDNGAVYRSGHMKQIVATLGIHHIVFTRPRRPMGNGKIEALNRLIRAAFIAELKASTITTLDALNEAFVAWADLEYNRKIHGQTHVAPLDRWRAAADQARYVDDEMLRQAFLWKEHRTPDKTGVFSLLGIRYQVSAKLARQRIQVRYDPEALHEVEIWQRKRFVERSRPLDVQPHRRPRDRAVDVAPEEAAGTAASANWLGHLVERRREEGFVEPPPQQTRDRARARRAEADQAVLDLLRERLDASVVDDATIRDYLERFGPFEPERAEAVLDRLLHRDGDRDRHVTVYLDAIRDQLGGGTDR